MIKWFILLTLLTMAASSPGNCQRRTIPGLTTITLPIALRTMRGKMVTSLQCHRSMKIPLTKAFACVKLIGQLSSLRTTGGCFCYRNIKGTNKLSQHALGIAIDLNPGLRMPIQIARCFEAAGFEWGGRWPRATYDPMHFQLRGN